MVKWIVVMKIQPSICLDDPSQVGRHLPNASLVLYHGATSLGPSILPEFPRLTVFL